MGGNKDVLQVSSRTRKPWLLLRPDAQGRDIMVVSVLRKKLDNQTKKLAVDERTCQLGALLGVPQKKEFHHRFLAIPPHARVPAMCNGHDVIL